MRTLPLPINSALARPLVPLFIRLRISANAITLLSLLCGVAGGGCFLRGTASSMVWGALGFFGANLLDECDGKVARLTNTASRLGAFLDTVTDCLVHMALFLGLGIGLSHRLAQPIWAILGMIAAGGSFLSFVLDVGGITPWPTKISPKSGLGGTQDFWAWVIEWLRIDFSLGVVVSAFLGPMGWILWAGAIGVFLFWIPSTVFISRETA